MSRVWLLVLFGLATAACSGLPRIIASPDSSQRSAWTDRCRAPFARHAYRAVHRIEASLPMGQQTDLLGISLVDPQRRSFRAVLVSVEGLTLFDGSLADGGLEIHRAVPPFDDEDFGQGLVADVALALLPPEASTPLVGRREDGRASCRYRSAFGPVSDLVLSDDAQTPLLERYDSGGALVRQVQFGLPGPAGLAQQIEIRAPGLAGYRLLLVLIQAEPAELSQDPTRP